jgi:glucuronokinase
MLLIKREAFARAGLIGNPSDGYHGKTMALVVRNFRAEVKLYEWERLEIVWSQEDQSRFDSIDELVEDVRLHGYYGGVRLVKATIKRFVEFCRGKGVALDRRNFSVRYQSDIPRCVGLAGSSAIIVATLRCLIDFYGLGEEQIPKRVLPSLALSVETEELGLPAGLQDRVVQVYEGLVFMDFAPKRMERIDGLWCGAYEPLEPGLLPPLYVAYREDAGEPTETRHGSLRQRYDRGDPDVLRAMAELAELCVQAREALQAGDFATLDRLIDRNFDIRRSICDLAPKHVEMVEAARACGLSAKFAGSGGAIVGTCPDDERLQCLKATLEPLGCTVIRPLVEAQASVPGVTPLA